MPGTIDINRVVTKTTLMSSVVAHVLPFTSHKREMQYFQQLLANIFFESYRVLTIFVVDYRKQGHH